MTFPRKMGLGDGTFLARTNLGVSPEDDGDAQNVVIADLDHDGASDLVLATCIGFTGGHVSVLMGVGDGTFGAERKLPAGGRPIAVSVGHLNGDLILDLAMANFDSDDVSILYGLGEGNFGGPHALPVGDGPRAIAVGNLNSYMLPKVVVVDVLSSTMTTLRNQLLGE